MASSEYTEDEIGSDGGWSQDVSIEEIGAELESLRAEIDALREENEQLREQLETIRADVDSVGADECDCSDQIEWRGDGRQLEDLWIDGVPVGNAITTRKQEIAELEADVDEARSNGTMSDPSNSIDDEWTLAEKALSIGPEEFLDSASEKRAVSILDRFSEWSSIAQAGRVIQTRDDKLKTLLEAERGESLAWKQVYRACEALEILSDGYIEWDSDRKMLVLTEPLPSMRTDDEY